jgi:hypothetical protein
VPERTLLYQHGNPEGGPLIHYRLVLDDDRQDELENRPLQSDDPLFGSFIFNDAEVYHSVGVHYHGSAWERPGNPRSFKVRLPGDHRLQGTKSFNVSRYGASANDASAHYLIGRNGLPGEPAPHCRYQFIRWDVGGEDQGIMGRVERVDGAYLKRWFRGDDEGPLLRANAKITFRVDEGWDLARWAAIEDWGADKEDYRWNWDLHTRELDDDWTQFLALFRIFDPGSTQSDAEFEARLAEKFDVDEFVRVVAVRALNTDWDSLGFGNGQNTYLYYAPIQGRWAFLPWDMDGTFGDAGFPFEPTADPGINRLLSRPNFYRKYLQAMRRSLFDGWQEETLHRFLAPSTAAGVGNEDGILGLLNARRPAALSFADRGGPFRVTTNGGRDFSVAAESVTLTGEAPIAARFILLDGVAFQPTWTGPTAWRAIVFLAPGPNPLEFLTFDDGGSLLGNATITVTSTITWQPPSLASLTPASGPEGGGTQVAIAGTDFHAGAAVRFGAADGVVASVTPTRIVVTAPPGAGAVDVRVTNRDGQSALRAGAFTYTRPRFIRGDASGDALVNIADSLAALDYLFAGGLLDCLSAADANDDGAVDISDPLRVLFFLFAAGAPLPPPGPTAGVDPTADALSCSRG